jgi:hypothetical protein
MVSMADGDSRAERSRGEAALIRLVMRPRLALILAVVGMCLASPSLFTGFHLDDYVGRYVYSNLEGARELDRIYVGGYGLANGNAADAHWQIEQGYAPWWIDPHLVIRMFRPISLATHWFDIHVMPTLPFLMHAENLLWFAALILASTRMYRGVLGPLVGGFAALLFAIDHTHAFVVGYVPNRHALIAAVFGALCLDRHFRSRDHANRREGVLAVVFYLLALLSSEAALAIAFYLFAYALVVERGSLVRRALGLAPYFVVTVVWRAVYTLAGYGAHGSGLYIDPAREPLRFLHAFAERGPILVLGQFFVPPAEVYVLVRPAWAHLMLIGAFVFLVALAVALVPLLARKRMARFWALAFFLALVPAASAFPHNRQLLFASFAAMALIAELWNFYAIELKGKRLSPLLQGSGVISAVLLFGHLILSPLAFPFVACSIAYASPMETAIADVGDDVVGRDAVFVTAPDYFAVKLVQLSRRVEHQGLPRRWRALSFGPQTVIVERPDDRTLVLDYQGGILSTAFLELYRDRRLRMDPGYEVKLEGLDIRVLEVTPDGRASRVQFAFDQPLDSPQFRFYFWENGGFSRYTPPPIGGRSVLPGAELKLGFK